MSGRLRIADVGRGEAGGFRRGDDFLPVVTPE